MTAWGERVDRPDSQLCGEAGRLTAVFDLVPSKQDEEENPKDDETNRNDYRDDDDDYCW